jgi:hypothetical protein
MKRITYLQGPPHSTVALADVGMGAAVLALPQDELTAAVRIGGILARHYGDRLPGEYRAVVAQGDGTDAAVVAEHDPRVLRARDLLAGIARDRDYTAEEFAAVRQTLIESAAHSP